MAHRWSSCPWKTQGSRATQNAVLQYVRQCSKPSWKMSSGTTREELAARESARGIALDTMLRGRYITIENTEFVFRNLPICLPLLFTARSSSYQDQTQVRLPVLLMRTGGTYLEGETIASGALLREEAGPSSSHVLLAVFPLFHPLLRRRRRVPIRQGHQRQLTRGIRSGSREATSLGFFRNG